MCLSHTKPSRKQTFAATTEHKQHLWPHGGLSEVAVPAEELSKGFEVQSLAENPAVVLLKFYLARLRLPVLGLHGGCCGAPSSPLHVTPLFVLLTCWCGQLGFSFGVNYIDRRWSNPCQSQEVAVSVHSWS